MNKSFYFCFQALFFIVSTVVLHLALFDFIGYYRDGFFTDWDSFVAIFLSDLPILVFDLIIGMSIGSFNCICLLPVRENLIALRNAIVVTDVFWLLFCFYWYFDNRGVINVEGIGHLISPFIVGFVGFITGLITLILSLALAKTAEEIGIINNTSH